MPRPWSKLALAAVLAAATAGSACGPGDAPAAQATAALQTTPTLTVNRDSGPAFDVKGITGWINSEPVSIAELTSAGRVVLVDFWTYTCVNCLRTLPFLRQWNEKYGERGLTILGVHTPEFEFEKVTANVEKAAAANGVIWPVAQDNDYATWNAFGNRYWPAKYLIGANGKLEYSHFGEGQYVETEKEIRAALTAAGHRVDDIPLGTVENQVRAAGAQAITREIYGGYGRAYGFGGLYAGQDAYYDGGDRTLFYQDPGQYEDDVYYLHGQWRNEKEAIVHARVTEMPEDYLVLQFQATSVNVVLQPSRDEPYDIVVEIDGRPLTPDEAGADIAFDGQGRSVIRVTQPEGRLYAVVELPEWGDHALKLASTSDNFAIFAFTFGVYESGI